jgi:hypothetical protein
MANSNKDSGNKVSLEELLCFKRAERPDEAFWEQFDNELHERMMQTLVKKDSWLTQVMRGLTGKIAQTTAVAASAAVLALMVIRPAFIVSSEQNQATTAIAGIEATETAKSVESVEITANEVDPSLMAEADYGIEVLSTSVAGNNDGVTQDYGLDHVDVASYDNSVYSADMALSGFTSTGVASLVY